MSCLHPCCVLPPGWDFCLVEISNAGKLPLASSLNIPITDLLAATMVYEEKDKLLTCPPLTAFEFLRRFPQGTLSAYGKYIAARTQAVVFTIADKVVMDNAKTPADEKLYYGPKYVVVQPAPDKFLLMARIDQPSAIDVEKDTTGTSTSSS